MKILGISGSLRVNSYSTALLKAINNYSFNDVQYTIKSISNIPLYNEDIEQGKIPEEIELFIEDITSADALLFSTPEYNSCISGVLKNSIDWASRSIFNFPLQLKPCGILSVSQSPVGGARAQMSLKTILSSTLTSVFPGRAYSLPNAYDKFNSEGELIDKTANQRLERYLGDFIEWVKKQS